MREIQASDAKTRFPELLRDVERGETLIITRHGRRIARLVPEIERRQAEIDEAIASLRSRMGTKSVSVEEILSDIREGQK